MGWSVGYDSNWDRDIGYGVPATCDEPGCGEGIDRGLSYVCGGEPYGGDLGCGLYFCFRHLWYKDDPQDETGGLDVCERCWNEESPYEPTPDVQEWIDHKMTDSSWAEWRKENGL